MQEIDLLTRDSRQVTENSVYVAIRGNIVDGHQFLPEVCAKNAAGIVVEEDSLVPADYRGAVVIAENTRRELNVLADRFYRSPASQLFCVGVTGTNGKTSVTYLIESIFNEFGWKTGVMGTVDHHIGETSWKTSLTTPDAIELNQRLREMVALGAHAVAFEVSSHAIAQHRAEDIPFDAVVFTNLTRDHLDYHGDMESYFKTKQRLFFDILQRSKKTARFAIVNVDDDYGRRLNVTSQAKWMSYGQNDAELNFHILESDFAGSRFFLQSPRGDQEFYLSIPGEHNVYNAAAAIGVALAAGISLDVCAEALKKFVGVPGRLQPVYNNKGIHVFVDYAHTDDALASVLKSLETVRKKLVKRPKILTLFGCGGDRDRGKRPLMLQSAMKYSDLVVVTSDNPRTENPESIIEDIVVNLDPKEKGSKVVVEVDRGEGIKTILSRAQKGDVVLIAGKGHEDYQIIGDTKYPFSDEQEVKKFFS